MLHLKWDGSDLGDITDYFVSLEEPDQEKIGSKLVLNINGKEITCLSWKYKDNTPILVDELKPIFGIPKIGRHKCIINNIEMLIAQRKYKNENIFIKDIHLYSLNQMEEIITLRFILGVIYRGDNFWFRPLCGIMLYYDNIIDFDRSTSLISKSTLKKHFDSNPENIKLAMIRLLKKSIVANKIDIDNEFYYIRILQLLRMEIEKVIKRVDPDFIWINTLIISRIQNLIVDE
jgi:hypothetical protein